MDEIRALNVISKHVVSGERIQTVFRLRIRLGNKRNESVKWFLHVSTEIDKRDPLRRFPDNYVPPRSLTLTKQKRVDSLGDAREYVYPCRQPSRGTRAVLLLLNSTVAPRAITPLFSFSLFLPRANRAPP